MYPNIVQEYNTNGARFIDSCILCSNNWSTNIMHFQTSNLRNVVGLNQILMDGQGLITINLMVWMYLDKLFLLLRCGKIKGNNNWREMGLTAARNPYCEMEYKNIYFICVRYLHTYTVPRNLPCYFSTLDKWFIESQKVIYHTWLTQCKFVFESMVNETFWEVMIMRNGKLT